MAKTYNELNELVLKHSRLLLAIGQSITNINSELSGKQDKLVYSVYDIKNIPQDICNALKVGDIVNKENHSYRVTFKKDNEGMCLTYVDASRVETQSYDLIDTVWTYNSEDLVEFNNYALKSEIPDAVSVITPQGTEPIAQGLRIGDTDYKLGGGENHLYRHTIKFKTSGSQQISFDIINNNSLAMTFNDVVSYLSSNGYLGHDYNYNEAKTLSATGGAITIDDSLTYFNIFTVVGVASYNNGIQIWSTGINISLLNGAIANKQNYSITANNYSTVSNFRDYFIQIL